MARIHRIAIPLFLFMLLAWLVVWVALSWPAIQDDALIHLRYADNFICYHSITYDGVHRDYGASSLLYVALLALLRTVSSSPNLARGVSSAVHLILFIALAAGLWGRSGRWPATARLAGMTLLLLLVTPGAVRWLDDGMETGIVVSCTSLIAWLLYDEHKRLESGIEGEGALHFILMVVLGFLTTLLRTELSLLCGVGSMLLMQSRSSASTQPRQKSAIPYNFAASSHLLLGAVLALEFIFATMHTLLPDTAKAKSLGIGHWRSPIHDTVVTLAGAMSFGAGMLIFWLITLTLGLMRRRRFSRSMVLANCFFPMVLTLASLRGQEIQGARYFAWTFFFPIIWNILDLGDGMQDKTPAGGSDARWLVYAFMAILMIELPLESVAMHRVLTQRGATVRRFEGQHLERLSNMRGVASDIGYIGYFTRANLCDLAGLVNGRPAAKMTSEQRSRNCVSTDPDFLFLNSGQLLSLSRYRNFSQWQVCARYDFTNVKTPDSHYLIVQPGLAELVCRTTGETAQPLSFLTKQKNGQDLQ